MKRPTFKIVYFSHNTALERVRQEFLEDAAENGKFGEEKKLLENELNTNVQAALDSLKK